MVFDFFKHRTLALFLALLAAGSTLAAELPKREPYSDTVAGYSLLLPTGYRRLTDDETRKVFKGMSDMLGKEIGERARKRPPAWFIGTATKPNEDPPSFAIGFAELDQSIDPAQIAAYKDELEEQHKREGDKVGNMIVTLVHVDGIASLQEEYDYSTPNNADRGRLIRLAVPGKGKWYEMYFNYSPSQNDSVRAALKETLESFKILEHPPQDIENRDKWLRVLYYTFGFGLAGIVLSFILQKLSRKDPRP